jgi:hypothetical protein
MEPSPGWEAQLDQLSTDRLGQLVRQTGRFVQTVRKRWAAGQFVPSWCTVTWIDDLAGQVVRAEGRLAEGGAASDGGRPARHAVPVASGAVLAAAIQAWLGHEDRADQARRFAALARDRILVAYAEQATWEATMEAFGRRAAAATRPPDPPT